MCVSAASMYFQDLQRSSGPRLSKKWRQKLGHLLMGLVLVQYFYI